MLLMVNKFILLHVIIEFFDAYFKISVHLYVKKSTFSINTQLKLSNCKINNI